jgi:hypothetical protein
VVRDAPSRGSARKGSAEEGHERDEVDPKDPHAGQEDSPSKKYRKAKNTAKKPRKKRSLFDLLWN